MSIRIRSILFAAVTGIIIVGLPQAGICARSEGKIVTRVDDVAVMKKGKGLVIYVFGMGTTPSHFTQSGELVRRNPNNQPNKEGLLEYNLVYHPPPNYTGFALKLVRATRKESPVPPEVKGVRIFAQYNQSDALIPAPQKKKGLFHHGEKKKTEETGGN